MGGKGKQRWEERARKGWRKGQGKVGEKDKERWEERARKGGRKEHGKVGGKGKERWEERTWKGGRKGYGNVRGKVKKRDGSSISNNEFTLVHRLEEAISLTYTALEEYQRGYPKQTFLKLF